MNLYGNLDSCVHFSGVFIYFGRGKKEKYSVVKIGVRMLEEIEK